MKQSSNDTTSIFHIWNLKLSGPPTLNCCKTAINIWLPTQTLANMRGGQCHAWNTRLHRTPGLDEDGRRIHVLFPSIDLQSFLLMLQFTTMTAQKNLGTVKIDGCASPTPTPEHFYVITLGKRPSLKMARGVHWSTRIENCWWKMCQSNKCGLIFMF